MSWNLISWRSIIAGVVISIAVSIIMSIMGVALGFTVVDPMSNDPLSGLGTAFGIWSVVSVVVALGAGAFAAGMFSPRRGGEHGLMVWATVVVVGTLFSGLAISSAVRTVGSVVHSVGSGVASVASTVGGGVADMASGAVDAIQQNVDLDINTDELGQQVRSVLRDTGVETLQPEYLRAQMGEARSDMRTALNQIRLNPDNYDQIITAFLDKERARLTNITDDIDRDAAVNAVMRARDIPRAEAEQTVDNAIYAYNQAVDRAQVALAEMQQRFNETRAYLSQAADQARVKADEFASGVAKSAIAAAVALILAGVLCWFVGDWGSRVSGRPAIIYEERQQIEIPATGTKVLPADQL